MDKSFRKNFKINVKRFPCIRALISKLKVERGIKINALVPFYTQANKKYKQSKSTSKQVKKYKKLIRNIYIYIGKTNNCLLFKINFESLSDTHKLD